MKLQIETSSYNERRYGKPWIAKVDFSANKKGNFEFGDWIGQAGSKGIMEVDVQVGDVIAIGQKDHRKPANGTPSFYIVGAGVSDDAVEWGPDMPGLEAVSKVDAYKHYESCERAKTASPSGYQLLEERAALLARIEQIDAQLKEMLGDEDE